MSLVGAPNWNLVHFDVACARCGCDLRGLDEPRCPRCEFEFDWSEAVPLEELICPTCGYHLCGLNDPRCPECGNAFTWDGVLEWYRRARSMLFEHHWRDRPVRSFLVSFARSVRPKRFWRELNIHDPVPVKPLLAMALIAWTLSAIAALVVFTLSHVLYCVYIRLDLGFPWGLSLASVVEGVRWELKTSGLFELSVSILSWGLCTLAALMVFQQSMRRYRVRAAHVVRVWAYAVLIVLLVLPAANGLFFCGIMLTCAPFFVVANAVWPLALFVLARATRSLQVAYRDYLKMDHSLSVAISAQLMAVPAAMILNLYAFDIR